MRVSHPSDVFRLRAAAVSCTPALHSYLHAEDSSLEVLNLDIDAVMNTQY